MKRMSMSLMLTLIASLLFISCDEHKTELKEFVEKFNNECPVPMGEIGSINSVMFDGETVQMKFTSNETFAPISSLSNHQGEVKEILGMGLSKDSSKKLVEKIIAAGASFRTIFIGNQTGQRAEFTLTANELENAIQKFINMNDKQKQIVTMLIGTKIKLPLNIDSTTKLVGLSLSSDALKYKFEVNDIETGQNMESALSFMKYITLSQMAQSLKGGMMGDRNRQFYQALVDCNQGAEYEYHEVQTGKRTSFRISTDEIKEVLNGKWDNQPSVNDWEDLGNTLEEYEEIESDTVWGDY